MRSRRRWLVPLGVVIGLALVGGLWAGWLAYRVNEHVSATVDAADRLQTAVLDHDVAGQQAALASMQEHSSAADEITQGTTWSVLARLPWLGDDAAGIRTASGVAADLTDRGIEPLIRTADELDSLLPRGAQISTDALVDLQQPVADGAAAFADAEAALAAEDPSSFTSRLRAKYREFEDKVSEAHQVLSAADTALTVMPSMLGADGPRQYLLAFQNNAEIRSTGGLPGAVSLVTATDGKIEMARQVAAQDFGERATPVLPLTPAERQIYGEQLGTYFLDANFTPDFPRTAELMRARWEEVYGDPIDGVISLDPVALSYILEAVGPVRVGDVELTADNAVDLLLHQVYLEYESPLAQDVFFRLVARAVFDKVSQGAESPIDLAEALARASREHRVYVHSFHAAEQEAIDPTAVAGLLTYGDPTSPQVGVYLNDVTGSKMSYFLRYRASVDSTYCSDGVQGLSGLIRLTSTAPEDAASLPRYVTGGGVYGTAPGRQLVFVRLYAPVDGSISDVELNSRPVRGLEVVPQDGRAVATIVVELGPGDTTDLRWRMKSGPDQTGKVRMSVTPGIAEGDASSTAVSSCG